MIKLTTPMLILLAFALAMDAFAVSVTNGMCYRIHPLKNAVSSGLAFGLFQGLMPLIGYLAGHTFRSVAERLDHWIALVLLGFIGGRMIVEALRERGRSDPSCAATRKFSARTLLVQAVATSIDALAVGLGLGVMQVSLPTAVATIAAVTFCCSFFGVLIGKSVGLVLKDKAEILGGAILVFIGLRIFLQHTGVIA